MPTEVHPQAKGFKFRMSTELVQVGSMPYMESLKTRPQWPHPRYVGDNVFVCTTIHWNITHPIFSHPNTSGPHVRITDIPPCSYIDTSIPPARLPKRDPFSSLQLEKVQASVRTAIWRTGSYFSSYPPFSTRLARGRKHSAIAQYILHIYIMQHCVDVCIFACTRKYVYARMHLCNGITNRLYNLLSVSTYSTNYLR